MDFATLATIVAWIAGAATFIGSMVWWLASQFRVTRDLIFQSKEDILKKLEYHERHDDDRFQNVRNDIWDIRLRNASIDGKKLDNGSIRSSRPSGEL
jgi:hypothetical protein